MRKVDMRGQVAIVTGGASGIGRALCDELAGRGCEVVLADRQLSLAEAGAQAIRGRGGRATAAALDVRDLAAFEALVAATFARTGRLDFVFNNAGIAVGGEMDSYYPEDWDDVIDVNLRGVTNGIHAAYPFMIRQGSGHIVNTASMAGLIAMPGEASYTATKHAVVGLTRSLRIEGKRHGVRASVLCPGAIQTPILTGGRYGRHRFDGLDEKIMKELWEPTRPMPAAEFARKALNDVLNNEAIIVYPKWWKPLWWLDRLSPALAERVFEAAFVRLKGAMAKKGVRAQVRG